MPPNAASEVWDQEKRFDVTVRLPVAARQSVDAIRNLRIPLKDGSLIPIRALADVAIDASRAAITLQALHGLSDFETVQELRCDLRWKAACGLGLHDMAFDPSLLAYFRRRLARSARPHRVFEAVREEAIKAFEAGERELA